MRTSYKISFIFVFVLVVAVLVCVFVNIANDDMASVDGKTHINILCLGIDEAADNTDTMILVSLDLNERSVCLLHIPRDTYFEKNTSNKKINNIYSTCLSDGDKCMDALLHTKQSISQAFSVPIDYCISFGLDSVSTVIDSVGGVELDIPCDMDYTDDTQQLNIHLKKGIQSLNGEQSLLFLRYRNTYLEGDIGRIDAQKIFISAFIKRVKSAVSPSSIALVAKELVRGSRTDISAQTIFSLCRNVVPSLDEYTVSYITLPGEAIRDDVETGLWYYVLNREATIDVLKKYYLHDLVFDSFDVDGVFVNEKNIGFENIYYASGHEYNTCLDEEISQIDIKLK